MVRGVKNRCLPPGCLRQFLGSPGSSASAARVPPAQSRLAAHPGAPIWREKGESIGRRGTPAARLPGRSNPHAGKRGLALHSDGIVYVKGAAEVLLERCAGALDPLGGVTACSSEVFRQAMEQMASQGLRVLAFARLEKPGAQSINFDDVQELTLLGLQGMMDPPRPEAVDAIRACQKAGITVKKVITGDHALTAAAIGRQIGLCQDDCATVMTGAELARLSDSELIEQAEKVTCSPAWPPNKNCAWWKLCKRAVMWLR